MSSIYEHLSKARIKSREDSEGESAEEQSDVVMPTNPEIRKDPALDRKDHAPLRLTGLKIGMAVALIVSGITLGASVYFFFMANADKPDYQLAMQAQTEELNRLSGQIQNGNREAKQEISSVKKQILEISQEKEALQREVNRSRIEISNLEKKVLQLADQNTQLVQKTEEIKKQFSSTNTPSYEAPAAPSSAFEITDASSQAEVPADSSAAVSMDAPVINPQVMTVNEKFNFIVVNIGSNDQLKMGDRLAVIQKGKTIGTVEVEKLYDSFAAATIVDQKPGTEISEGDSIEKR